MSNTKVLIDFNKNKSEYRYNHSYLRASLQSQLLQSEVPPIPAITASTADTRDIGQYRGFKRLSIKVLAWLFSTTNSYIFVAVDFLSSGSSLSKKKR